MRYWSRLRFYSATRNWVGALDFKVLKLISYDSQKAINQMKPGARIQASVEMLGIIWGGSAPPDIILNDYFRRRRYAGAADRRVIAKHVYDILRRRAKLDWWVTNNELNLEPSPRLSVIVDLVLVACMSVNQIIGIFSGDKYCPIALDEDETKLVKSLQGHSLYHPDMPRPIALEYPAWMDKLLSRVWGERFQKEIVALNEQAPVDLRVNTLKVTREDAQKALSEASIASRSTPLSPAGLRIKGQPRLLGTAPFKNGFVEIQDEGSQLLAFLVGARPGMVVIDFCAGTGGKTLALAATMARDGRLSGSLHACDVSSIRLSRMNDRIRRAGAVGINIQRISRADDNWVHTNVGIADRVLADVPCTGTGRWRRDLNLRWRYRPIDLRNFRLEQQAIMTKASSLVKLGGRFIYATCSVLEEENEQQIAWFLARNKCFTPLPIDEVWSETIGNHRPQTGLELRLSPGSTATDGFFCAVMERCK